MTALAGIWNFDGRPDAKASCDQMLKSQQAYGPHGANVWSAGEVAIGRRLFRTLPEDVFDNQPLAARDSPLALIADVRLDNRDELERALGASSVEVSRTCDAALLLASLERWGEGALDRVVGDFAFALWNAQTRQLWLARDFAGQRPLHYHRSRNFFAFASMPKGLHALPGVPYAADAQAMAEFLALIPEGRRSFFEGIEAVEPGRLVVVTSEGVETRRFWNPTPESVAREPRKDFVEGLRHHLDEATRARLRGANAEVGAQLSGGLDSAAVAATAARLLAPQGGKVIAFTAVPREGYDGPVPSDRISDEGALAAASAAMHANIEHVLVRAGRVSPLHEIDRSFYLFDRPTLNLCNRTWWDAINEAAQARGLTVMLTGQMGNATLSYAGYEMLPTLLRAGRISTLLRVGAELVATGSMRWLGVLATALGPFVPTSIWRGMTRIRGQGLDVSAYSAINSAALRERNLQALARQRGLDLSYRPRTNGFETRLWIVGRASLGNYNKGILAGWGIDQRDPTADRRLVEYCLGVPMTEFLKNGEPRELGRAALRDRLPGIVIDEKKKGYQGADWHEGLGLALAETRMELERISGCEAAAEILDLDRMKGLVGSFPDGAWHRGEVLNSWRYALLRGLSAGHFLRKVAGVNS